MPKRSQKPRLNRYRFPETAATTQHPDWDTMRLGPDYIERDDQRIYTKGAFAHLSNGQKEPTVQEDWKPAQFTMHPAWTPQAMEVMVTRLVPNPNILMAKDAAGEEVHVWVGDSKNFAVGMKVPVVRHDTQDGWWKCARALPQDKGRW